MPARPCGGPLYLGMLTIALSCAPAFADQLEQDYLQQKEAIGSRFEQANTGCKSLAGNARDVCVAKARADREIGLAELEAGYRNTEEARTNASRTRAKATYEVDKEVCDELGGNNRAVCDVDAKARRDKALADVDAGRKTVAASDEADRVRRESDYKVAKQKCEALAGDARAACIDAAKKRFLE
ncbi:hypothetical protein [Niveibacterium sp. SC-1]|uniref:hypothetical protein n=1 Tax=Niveibacterium sp. SC-1 TaxID=3135646 RepID=UPI00311E9309